jgi:2-polyprenyl-3-methyl-5-hydroxy-6-metoxy-1,4-benzoquinol methylase
METVKHYDANYGQFSTEVYAAVRREAFGEDIGQNSWLTADEHDLFIEWMAPRRESRVLDIACGSGRTTLRIARKTGCSVHGIDMHAAAIAEAKVAAEQAGLTARAQFDQGDASKRLVFDDATFDALICIDAINHLPNRPAVLAEWARILKPGGVLVFTDPIVVTGALTAEEMTIRSSIGFFLFVPPGLDERLLADAGFDVTDVADRTENMAVTAYKRMQARQRLAKDLRVIEGDETFDGQQRFLETASQLAADRRLSRFAFRAVRR